MSSILDQLDEPNGTGWRPKVGEVIVGRVLRLTEGVSTYDDKPYPIVIIKADDGQIWNVHAFHSVLKSELAKARPARGDTIAIRYEGKPAGKSYEFYKLAVERADGKAAGPDWDAMAEQASAELGDAEGYGDEAPF